MPLRTTETRTTPSPSRQQLHGSHHPVLPTNVRAPTPATAQTRGQLKLRSTCVSSLRAQPHLGVRTYAAETSCENLLYFRTPTELLLCLRSCCVMLPYRGLARPAATMTFGCAKLVLTHAAAAKLAAFGRSCALRASREEHFAVQHLCAGHSSPRGECAARYNRALA